MKSRSIISNDKFCLICGTPNNLHRHHIFGGVGRRNLSEIDGCWVYLCAKHHNASKDGVHCNKQLDIRLKEYGQKEWEFQYGSREEFIERYGRNYIYE